MTKEQLAALIENKRAELIEIVMIEGLNSPNTIQYSQELDLLLNQYNRAFPARKKLSTYKLKSKTS